MRDDHASVGVNLIAIVKMEPELVFLFSGLFKFISAVVLFLNRFCLVKPKYLGRGSVSATELKNACKKSVYLRSVRVENFVFNRIE